MSFHVFFSLSQGLSASLTVPKGTRARLNAHVAHVEAVLKIERTKYRDNPAHWNHWKMDFSHVSDETLCEIAEDHNAWVRDTYRDFGEWSKKPPTDGEQLTPEEAQEFWPGFEMINVDPARWTKDYYRARMECVYEVMRGRTTDGISFDTKALTTKQAAAVINLFSEFLEPGDLRLDVPHGRDYLASSYDGGYRWCDKCFRPIAGDESGCSKKKCPLREEDQE